MRMHRTRTHARRLLTLPPRGGGEGAMGMDASESAHGHYTMNMFLDLDEYYVKETLV
jgi:hypothetical protein